MFVIVDCLDERRDSVIRYLGPGTRNTQCRDNRNNGAEQPLSVLLIGDYIVTLPKIASLSTVTDKTFGPTLSRRCWRNHVIDHCRKTWSGFVKYANGSFDWFLGEWVWGRPPSGQKYIPGDGRTIMQLGAKREAESFSGVFTTARIFWFHCQGGVMALFYGVYSRLRQRPFIGASHRRQWHNRLLVAIFLTIIVSQWRLLAPVPNSVWSPCSLYAQGSIMGSRVEIKQYFWPLCETRDKLSIRRHRFRIEWRHEKTIFPMERCVLNWS